MSRLRLQFGAATIEDAAELVRLRTEVAQDLTERHGRGHWSLVPSLVGVSRDVNTSTVLVARARSTVVGTLRLATKKPWAIDPAYFHPVRRALYLVDMAVDPAHQRQGIGRRLLDEGIAASKAFPADSIRLDAYDTAAGAGEFYAKCGFREVGRVVYRKTPLIYFEMLL
jgi:ribosomal protein S18 acetylase RimI-like enzyme